MPSRKPPAIRRPRAKSPEKRQFLAGGGPFRGKRIWLTRMGDETASTALFSVGEYRGRYVEVGHCGVRWEPHPVDRAV